MLKLYTGTSYIYRKICILNPIVVPKNYETLSFSLIQKKGKWQLHIPIETRVKLIKVVDLINTTPICAVDLGINNHVCMTIQDSKGRVLATKFISAAEDNHLRKHYLEAIARKQRVTKIPAEGERLCKSLWEKVSNFNDNLAHQISRQIVDFAKEHEAKIIVFEHLNSLKPDGKTKAARYNKKLMYWLKGRIFNYTKYKAKHSEITVSRVNPKFTSKRCPYCGYLTIVRYTPNKLYGVNLGKCTNCGTHDVNADFIGSIGIGNKLRLRYA